MFLSHSRKVPRPYSMQADIPPWSVKEGGLQLSLAAVGTLTSVTGGGEGILKKGGLQWPENPVEE